MRIVNKRSKRCVTEAAQTILNGGVIIYPTETIYGLGANAIESKIVRKVFAIKERHKSNPILVLIPERSALDELTLGVPGAAEKLMNAFWPGPLTIVFKAAPIVSPELTAGSGKIGIRLSSDKFCQELVEYLQDPDNFDERESVWRSKSGFGKHDKPKSARLGGSYRGCWHTDFSDSFNRRGCN